MIQLIPHTGKKNECSCGADLVFSEFIWQGVHIAEKYYCPDCKTELILSLPVNQGTLRQLKYYPDNDMVTDVTGMETSTDWYSSKLKAVGKPDDEIVEIRIEEFRKSEEVIILNTLDFVFGHSILFLFNLERIAKTKNHPGIIVLVQPMLRWLVPENLVSEIWTVNLGFGRLNSYFPVLSGKINKRISQYNKVWLSRGHPIPTNENISIEIFTGIRPYNFELQPEKPRITFIWRQDPDRLWIKNFYILKGFKRLGISYLLLPFHLMKTKAILKMLRKKLGNSYRLTVAGLGSFGTFQKYVEDLRITVFNTDSERLLCNAYSESILVFGMHGSSMILPSAQAGMAISMMPAKRWGNYAEDILFNENDLRLALYQRRIIPAETSLQVIRDIITEMCSGRDYFIRKFVHSNDL